MIKVPEGVDFATEMQTVQAQDVLMCDVCNKELVDGFIAKPITIMKHGHGAYVRTLCGDSCLWLDSFKSEYEYELELA